MTPLCPGLIRCSRLWWTMDWVELYHKCWFWNIFDTIAQLDATEKYVLYDLVKVGKVPKFYPNLTKSTYYIYVPASKTQMATMQAGHNLKLEKFSSSNSRQDFNLFLNLPFFKKLNQELRHPAHFNIYYIVVMDRYKISRGERLQECKWEKKPKSKSPGSTWNPGAELISTKNGILFPKLSRSTLLHIFSSDREKLWNSRLKVENLQNFWYH